MSMLDSRLGRRVRRSSALRPVGIAAYRTVDRLRPAKPGPRVVANSMPKSGTHLLTAMLEQLEGFRFSGYIFMMTPNNKSEADRRLGVLEQRVNGLRPSRFMGAHLSYDPDVENVIEASGAHLVTILRDPRAPPCIICIRRLGSPPTLSCGSCCQPMKLSLGPSCVATKSPATPSTSQSSGRSFASTLTGWTPGSA